MPLAPLLPEGGNRYIAWVFGTGRNNDAIAEEMVGEIKEYGLPFMQSIVTLADFYDRMMNGLGHEHLIIYRRPAALFLNGQPMQARSDLEAELERQRDRDDVAAQEFRRFAVALHTRIGETR